MEIRKYEQGDKDRLISLWRQVFPDDPPHNEPAKVLESKLMVDDLVFVAVEGEHLVGGCIAGYDGHRGWLYSVAVAAGYRRKGVGQELVNFTIKSLAELGCIKVNLQVRSTNAAVVAFYETLGFNIEERISMGKRVDGNA